MSDTATTPSSGSDDADVNNASAAQSATWAARCAVASEEAAALARRYAEEAASYAILAPQVNADWNALSGPAEILNKPNVQPADHSLMDDANGLRVETEIVLLTGADATIPDDCNGMIFKVDSDVDFLPLPLLSNVGAGRQFKVINTSVPQLELRAQGRDSIDDVTLQSFGGSVMFPPGSVATVSYGDAYITVQTDLGVGTQPFNLVQLDTNGRLPALDGSALTSLPMPDVSGLVPKSSVGAVNGVASLDGDARVPVGELPAGTSPGQIVMLDAQARLPAVDGSQLFNLPPSATVENLVLNGSFAVNQRQYQQGAAGSLGSSVYRHDGWRDGTYTFAQVPGTDPRDTTVTITGSTPLRQVIDGTVVAGGTYTLSWAGSAVGRLSVGANNAPTGVAQPSPITVNNVQWAAGFQIDFQPGGTLGQVQLTPGATPIPFLRRSYEVELMRCYRKVFVIYASHSASVLGMGYVYGSGTNVILVGSFPIPMSAPQRSRVAVTQTSLGTASMQAALPV